VQAAEDAWNTRDPERVAGAYTVDSAWRNRATFLTGRAAIIEFLTSKWRRELDYALRKNLWAFRENRIAVRFQYECHDVRRQWWRSYGNELWEFDVHGLMRRREASINDIPIEAGRGAFTSSLESSRSGAVKEFLSTPDRERSHRNRLVTDPGREPGRERRRPVRGECRRTHTEQSWA
jgi:uncharacterized protein